MAALAERRVIPHDELKSRSKRKAEGAAASEEAAAAATRPEDLRLLEALLFAAAAPLDERRLAARLPSEIDVRAEPRALQIEYASRGVNLVRIAGKWTFRTANDLSWLLTKEAWS